MITIPDDHDVGQANIWGENGKTGQDTGRTGGRFITIPPNTSTWSSDVRPGTCPIRTTPHRSNAASVFTSPTCGSGASTLPFLRIANSRVVPKARFPKWDLAPITSTIRPTTARRSICPSLKLLGDRQLKFLDAVEPRLDGGRDESGAQPNGVLRRGSSCTGTRQPAIGRPGLQRLAANGTKRGADAIRRAWAPHICGDQHLAVLVQHGIESPVGWSVWLYRMPAIVNTIYGRWWHPEDEQPGENPVPDSPLALDRRVRRWAWGT